MRFYELYLLPAGGAAASSAPPLPEGSSPDVCPCLIDQMGPISPSVFSVMCLLVEQEHLIRKEEWKQEVDAFSPSFNYGCLTVSGSVLIFLPERSFISRQM